MQHAGDRSAAANGAPGWPLADNVIDDLIAYLYVTLEYNLLRYLRRNGGFDEILFIKLKDYLLHSLLPHGHFQDECRGWKG